MEFDYVVGWYSKKAGSVKPLGGFENVKAAKEFSEGVDSLFWGNGFFFIDSPEGTYIKGYEDFMGNKKKWFSPEEVKSDKVFLLRIENGDDAIIRIDNYLPYDDYKKFTITNSSVFKALEQNERNRVTASSIDSRDSVLSKLSDNKKAAESRYAEHTQQEKLEKQRDDVVR